LPDRRRAEGREIPQGFRRSLEEQSDRVGRKPPRSLEPARSLDCPPRFALRGNSRLGAALRAHARRVSHPPVVRQTPTDHNTGASPNALPNAPNASGTATAIELISDM